VVFGHVRESDGATVERGITMTVYQDREKEVRRRTIKQIEQTKAILRAAAVAAREAQKTSQKREN
jgi:hypothetical protein